jgi:hypothetical protein
MKKLILDSLSFETIYSFHKEILFIYDDSKKYFVIKLSMVMIINYYISQITVYIMTNAIA